MNLTDYLPDFWDKSAEVLAIQRAMEPSVAQAWADRDGLLAQLNVRTATWGLVNWETSLGLSTDVGKDVEYRRTRIISKLRGQGTTTVAMIKNVAESFSNGQVDVVEHPAEYRFDVKFVGTIGVPPNMDDLTAAIEDIKPAHLAYDYIIIFRTWQQVRANTWGALRGSTWGAIKGGEI